MQLTPTLSVHPASYFGKPEVNGCKDCHCNGVKNDVVEVTYYKVSIIDVDIKGVAASITPVIPPKINIAAPPIANSIGVSRCNLLLQIVAVQANALTPVGMATNIEVAMKVIRIQPGVALVNM